MVYHPNPKGEDRRREAAPNTNWPPGRLHPAIAAELRRLSLIARRLQSTEIYSDNGRIYVRQAPSSVA
jgi:hypothetical protein